MFSFLTLPYSLFLFTLPILPPYTIPLYLALLSPYPSLFSLAILSYYSLPILHQVKHDPRRRPWPLGTEVIAVSLLVSGPLYSTIGRPYHPIPPRPVYRFNEDPPQQQEVVDFNFSSAPVGAEQSFVDILFKNTGSLPCEW